MLGASVNCHPICIVGIGAAAIAIVGGRLLGTIRDKDSKGSGANGCYAQEYILRVVAAFLVLLL